MKAIKLQALAMVAKVVATKKQTDLLIIRITNLKIFTTIESLVISMAQ
jgi:hypothetical protein